ncbi:MAG: YdcH family protein [Chitinophagales bacterium]
METGAEATADETLNQLRLKRVHLKDELYAMLKQA